MTHYTEQAQPQMNVDEHKSAFIRVYLRRTQFESRYADSFHQ